ncbi:MAG TPA: primosomal protein N', partial [Firmicutes bacterium]|nr:primosomal protein N' [Bacillota bacterium]
MTVDRACGITTCSAVACGGHTHDAAYARVIVDVVTETLDRPLDYSIPDNLKGCVAVGSLVIVPLGNRKVGGYVVGLSDRAEVPRTRDILSVVGEAPLLDETMVRLAMWIRDRYACRACEAIRSMLPAPVRSPKAGRSRRQDSAPRAGPAPAHIPAPAPVSSPVPSARVDHTPARVISLTPAQARAVATIQRALTERSPKPILLHGVTASGKTEVYLQAIRTCLDLGRSAIVLVPEISLTPQIVGRFKARFGEQVAVLHSRLSAGERANEWRRLARGEARVAIGARSCVFAPCHELGLIILDEEHEATYKQEETPRYHARDAAIKRASLEGAAVVLASATPSIESFYKAMQGEYEYVELPERIDARPMPVVDIVDMRREHMDGNRGIFSRRLKDAIIDRLGRGESIMLFLNRRGYSTFVLCRECGHALKCPNCDVSLTLHSADGVMRCHWCGHEEPVPLLCPNCKGHRIGLFGVGTERVEAEVRRVFAGARVLRMDLDTTRRKGSHESILSAFSRGEYNVLVGTQMIAK